MSIIFNPWTSNQINRLAQGAASLAAGRAWYKHGSTLDKKPQLDSGRLTYKNSNIMVGAKRKRTYKKKASSKVATVATVKRMLRSKEEVKQICVQCSTGAMTRGDFYTRNLTAQVIQGTADGQRVGDTINLNSLHLNGFIAAGTTAQHYQVRIIVFYGGEEYNPASMTTAGYAFSELMIPNAIALTGAMGIINSKAISVLYDRTYEINSLISGVSDAIPVVASLNLKGVKFNFQATGSVYGKTKNLYIVCASYAPTDTGAADRASLTLNVALKYSDS